MRTLLLALMLLHGARDGASASAVAEEVALDFGEAIQGTRVHLEARLSNTTQSLLRIVPVASGCGCAVAGEVEIPARGQVLYAIELDTTKTNTGYVLRHVELRAEPSGGTILVTVHGTVLPPFSAVPNALLVTADLVRFTVELRGPVAFSIIPVEPPAEGWVLETTAGEPQRIQRVTVRRSASAAVPKELVFRVVHRLGEGVVSVPVGAR